ncbi:M20 family metallopeptidase [Sporosarcina cyprini]|uniref:M20 family metallopeptidase n=1 Tax=Sporosarcina cyprini TaxID=2910523 RepID=UPI001EDCAA16|nr:M20 family metallopeptidase [Sporosarcina cyprini]MCG3088136.1 M20 family metallopeptidase [Sporosarcina cyprini]
MKNYLQSKESEMLALLERLVSIDSGSSHKKGVDNVGEVLREQYTQIGFCPKMYEQSENGDNIVLTLQDSEIKPTILFIAHMDTVFKTGTAKQRPFTVKGDRAYGPGVIDMKASQVALLYAMKALKEHHPEVLGHVQIVLNGDEEIGSPTSRSLIEECAAGKQYALVMEPARKDGSLVTARRGGGRYTMYIKGKGAHSGIEPQNGISAIEELAHKIIKLHALTDHEAGVSVSVGIVEGGESVNTIAPSAVGHVDVRITSADQAEWLDRSIREICEVPDVAGTSIVLEGGLNRPPMEKNEQTVELLSIIQEVGKELGITITDVATGGGSDASFTSSLGIPTIDGLGPIGGNAHSDEEYLEIASFVERTELLAKVLVRLLGKQ